MKGASNCEVYFSKLVNIFHMIAKYRFYFI